MSFYDWFFRQEGRTPEGLFSWQHLLSVTIGLGIFAAAAIICAHFFKGKEKKQNGFIGVMALLIIATQVAKYAWLFYESSPEHYLDTFLGNFPLYLCDMQLYMIPICFFARGRFKNICCDFIAIWGILMGLFGTYLAGNIYPGNCVISFFALDSLVNHAVSLGTGLFIFLCGMNTMEKKNIPFTIGILVAFMTAALIIDYAADRNFMFFFRGDGTPFDFFKALVKDNLILYQMEIYILQCGYMGLFYLVYYLVKKAVTKHQLKHASA